MNRSYFRYTVRTFLLTCAIASCAVAGPIMRNNWRHQLFADLEKVGNRPSAPLRVLYEVDVRWLGLFGSDFSKLNRPTAKQWWFDPRDHRYVRSLTVYFTEDDPSACDAILEHHESLRGLETLELAGTGKTSSLHFPRSAANLPDVRLLKLSNLSLSREHLESISHMPDLEILHLGSCEFQVADLEVLRSAKHLAWVSFYHDCHPETLHRVRASLPAVYVSPFRSN